MKVTFDGWERLTCAKDGMHIRRWQHVSGMSITVRKRTYLNNISRCHIHFALGWSDSTLRANSLKELLAEAVAWRLAGGFPR